MPNWCYNSTTFFCQNKEMYDKLLASIESDKWFKTFAPLGLDKEKYENGWEYNKALEVWGTKWEPDELEIFNNDKDDFLIQIYFNTAWSPPLGVYKEMYNNFGIEIASFYEESSEFFGWCKYSKALTFDESYTIPSNKEELASMKKKIHSDLNDFMESTWDELEEQWQEE